jgi:hypothetical protein
MIVAFVTFLRGLLLGNATKAGLVAIGIALALAYHHSVYRSGEVAAIAKQKEADHAAIAKGNAAVRRSADPGVAGVLDPYTRP